MKITFILPKVSIGGGIKVAGIYANALVKKGHEVVLVSPPPRDIPFRRKIKSLVTGHGWPRYIQPHSHLDGLDLDHRILECWRKVTDDDVPDADIVIATWWETAEWVAALNECKGAKVYFIQGHEIFPHCPKERVKATYRLPFHKITISKWLIELLRNEYCNEIVNFVPNSVDYKDFFATSRSKQINPTIGFLFSKSWVKGIDTSVSALNILKDLYPNLRVLSFGTEDPDTQFLLPKYVEFHRLPPPEQMRQIYSTCDVWLCGSRTEGFHLPPAEAMACRTPVVSTKVGGPIDLIVNGINGVLVDIDDVAGLVSGVKWILDLPAEEWHQVSEKAYETVASGSWDKSATLFEKALMDACQRAKRGEIQGICSHIK